MSPRSTRRADGMTLLEVLVTLVIVAMVAALAAQGMQQLARVERLLEDAGSEAQQRMLRREWLRGLIGAALPEQVSTPLQFVGDGQALQLSSALALEVPLAASQAGGAPATGAALRIELRPLDGEQGHELRLRADARDREGVRLLRWQGNPGRIQYLDHAGQWQDRWPADTSLEAPRRPPALVRIDLGPEAGGVLLAPVRGSEPPRPRLADWAD